MIRLSESRRSQMNEFHKSTYSHVNGDCVEVAEGAVTRVRDSRNRARATLAFPATEWRALLADIDSL
ncbi:DUF397 domain-containing protein [Nocardiopsis mangrovi]|uniref:DUF397 domain-containing protein n=1 Tax=Nocardiopsis mangrovi TaxID=1179818 RepID=A0ABV9DUB2_9ACTN